MGSMSPKAVADMLFSSLTGSETLDAELPGSAPESPVSAALPSSAPVLIGGTVLSTEGAAVEQAKFINMKITEKKAAIVLIVFIRKV